MSNILIVKNDVTISGSCVFVMLRIRYFKSITKTSPSISITSSGLPSSLLSAKTAMTV
ncbi:MAG: hypothetical protein P9L91_05620 [Candidatus Zophobacter franzmannii]|nr:hypothetical protein [Candidatus Zophobacter franzmannii]